MENKMKIFKKIVAIFSFKKITFTEYSSNIRSHYQGTPLINFVATNIKNNNILDL